MQAFFNKENCAAVGNFMVLYFTNRLQKLKIFASENHADSGDKIICFFSQKQIIKVKKMPFNYICSDLISKIVFLLIKNWYTYFLFKVYTFWKSNWSQIKKISWRDLNLGEWKIWKEMTVIFKYTQDFQVVAELKSKTGNSGGSRNVSFNPNIHSCPELDCINVFKCRLSGRSAERIQALDEMMD